MNNVEQIESHVLPNGIRLIHKHIASSVSYCGFLVNVGARDERTDQSGMAHLVEHMLFKGTEHRKAHQIINRLEHVGGDLNAYTTQEETALYSTVLMQHTERAIELMADMLFRSTFPQTELNKELVVILDEIESYNDSPSELIYDDFEALLFEGHSLEMPILGTSESLMRCTSESLRAFMHELYHPEQMVFFSQGSVPFKKIIKWAERYFVQTTFSEQWTPRVMPLAYKAKQRVFERDTHQVHIMCGNRAYDLHHPKRLGLFLLNNILGGPGMNSLLNLALREKNGYVYHVDSSYTPLSDTGYWSVYFGCDIKNKERCMALFRKEIAHLRNKELTSMRLHTYKQQLCGQMAISAENRENGALSMAKNWLHFNKIEHWKSVCQRIEALTPLDLMEVANEIFDESQITEVRYE